MDLITGLGLGAAALLGYEVVLKPKAAVPLRKPASNGPQSIANMLPNLITGQRQVQTGAPLAGQLIGLGTTLAPSVGSFAKDFGSWIATSSTPNPAQDDQALLKESEAQFAYELGYTDESGNLLVDPALARQDFPDLGF